MALETLIVAKTVEFESNLDVLDGDTRKSVDVTGAVTLESLDVISSEEGFDLANACVSAWLDDHEYEGSVNDAWNAQDGVIAGEKIAEELWRGWMRDTGIEVVDDGMLVTDVKTALEKIF